MSSYRRLPLIRLLLLVAFSGLFQSKSYGQVKSSGLPLIRNFTQSTYQASTQNWEITQNSRGFVYFANNDGLLEYDGQHWKTYPIPNRSIVRSVKSVNDTLYVGAYEEFGFFAADGSGKLTYHSLLSLVPQQYRSFDEVWRIYHIGKTIVFQSFKAMFLFDSGRLRAVEPAHSFGHSYAFGNDFAYVDHPNSLMAYSNGNPRLLVNHPLLSLSELRGVIALSKEKYLLAFIDKGLFVLENGRLKSWDTEVSKWLIRNSVFSALRLSGGNLAFGSIQDGLIISDQYGNIVQHLNRFKGLQNNTVLSMFEDVAGNLWLGLDNGIDFIEINSPLSVFNHTHHIESAYASAVFDNKLYVGTNQGLFFKPLEELNNGITGNKSFGIVEGTEGQVWSLQVVHNTLLCGHNFGLFQVSGNQARKVSAERGYWNFETLTPESDTLICGTYNGLAIAVFKNNQWIFSHHIRGFEESCKNFVFDPDHYEIWMAHGYRGIYHLKLNLMCDEVLESRLYHGENGLPAELPYNVFRLRGKTVFATKEGLKQFDSASNSFIDDEKNSTLFGTDVIVDQAITDEFGNIWYFASGKLGLLRRIEDGTFSNVTSPFLRINQNLIRSFENVNVNDNHNVFIGSKNGLVHYDPAYQKDYSNGMPLVFREVDFYSNNKHNIGYNLLNITNDKKWVLPYRMNSLRIEFANPEFEGTGSCLFTYRLKGAENVWTSWSPLTYKEYNNLPEGNYLFELRSKGVGNSGEKYAAFAFKIRPPFYRTAFAYFVYILLLIGVAIGNVWFIQQRVVKTRLLETEKHTKVLLEQEQGFREQALIAEKEIVHLRNESLQSQVSHKTKELANNTLHLIHKNKILNSIKSQLIDLLDNNLSQTKRNQIEGIVNKINKELKSEKFQEVFNEYFDDVHQNFIARLKDSHPDLSPRELRLCAYLKMNLSTKEIAPLMNISVRGVEIGRYRLRKKLGLERDDNLIDYLIKF